MTTHLQRGQAISSAVQAGNRPSSQARRQPTTAALLPPPLCQPLSSTPVETPILATASSKAHLPRPRPPAEKGWKKAGPCAMLTLMAAPSRSRPPASFSASRASLSSSNVTKPNPLDLPVSLSYMSCSRGRGRKGTSEGGDEAASSRQTGSRCVGPEMAQLQAPDRRGLVAGLRELYSLTLTAATGP